MTDNTFYSTLTTASAERGITFVTPVFFYTYSPTLLCLMAQPDQQSLAIPARFLLHHGMYYLRHRFRLYFVYYGSFR